MLDYQSGESLTVSRAQLVAPKVWLGPAFKVGGDYWGALRQNSSPFHYFVDLQPAENNDRMYAYLLGL